MSTVGYVYLEFVKYVLYGEMQNAVLRIIVYKKDTTTGALVKHKDLAPVCHPYDVHSGVGMSCTTTDTSQDEYTADAFAIGRTPFTVDGVTSEVVMIYYTTVSKTRDQKLDIELKVELTY